MSFPKVHMTWIDPTSYQSWTDLDLALAKPPTTVENVGWLIHQPTKSHPYYVLAGQLINEEVKEDYVNAAQVADFIVIPKGCKVSIKTLTNKKG